MSILKIKPITPPLKRENVSRYWNKSANRWEQIKGFAVSQDVGLIEVAEAKKAYLVVWKVNDALYLYSPEMTEVSKLPDVDVNDITYNPEANAFTAVTKFGTYQSSQIVKLNTLF